MPGVPGSAVPEPLEPDEPDEPDEPTGRAGRARAASPSSLSCCANGSLLAKRLKDASCPSWTTGVPGAGVGVEPETDAGCSAPPSVGAASVGVPVGVVESSSSARRGQAAVFIIFITLRHLERRDAEEDHAEHCGEDLLLLLLRLDRIDGLLRHYGAPAADAPSDGVSVVVVSVG